MTCDPGQTVSIDKVYEMVLHNGIKFPVLRYKPSDGHSVKVFCPLCSAVPIDLAIYPKRKAKPVYHTHGNSDGFRSAHCSGRGSVSLTMPNGEILKDQDNYYILEDGKPIPTLP